MNIFIFLSNMMIPLTIFTIVATAALKGTHLYDDFVSGAMEGIKTVGSIAPTMVGLMIGVGVLRSSGFLELLAGGLGTMTRYVGLPGELMPAVIVRMFSSSAATGLVLDLFAQYGTDSDLGKIASIMMSSTETIFYTMSVYYMAASRVLREQKGQVIGKTRWTLTGALVSTIAGITASVMFARWI